MVASCTPWDRSSTSSLPGHRVAAMRARRSSRASSGTSTWKGRIAVESDFAVVTDICVSWVDLTEREAVGLGARLEEGDLEHAPADLAGLPYELVHAAVLQNAVPVLVRVHPVRRAQRLAVEEHAEGDRIVLPGRHHEVRVARVEAEADAAARLVEHDGLALGGPLPAERPIVGALAARPAEIRLGRAQMVPVGLGLVPDSLDGDQLALDAEQLLDLPLRLLVAPLAEVGVADDPLAVDEVLRGPVVIVEGAPDRVVVVDRDRVGDLPLGDVRSHQVDVVLERELRGVDADHHEPVVPVGVRARADVGLGAQTVDAGQGPEVDEHHLSLEPLGAERLGAQPLGRPVQRGHVQTREDAHREKRPEPRSERMSASASMVASWVCRRGSLWRLTVTAMGSPWWAKG